MSYARNNKYVDKSSSVSDSDGNRYMEPWGKLGLKYAPHYYHSQSVADSSPSVDTTNGPFSKQLRRGFQRRKIAIILFVIGLIAITAAIIPILVITLRPAESHPDKIRVVTMKLSVDAIFKPEYYDKSSLEYQSFEANFSAAIGLLYNTGSIKGYNGLQIQELRNGSIIVIFIIVIEVKQNQDLPNENEIKAIITEQQVDAGDQNFVFISNFRIQKTSVTVESTDESQNNPLSTKRTTSTTTSTSTSTTTPTTTSTTSANTKQGTTSTTSSSRSDTTPTKSSTSPATVNPSTTSTTSSSTYAATASTTSSTSPTTVNPSTTSITSTATSTTIPTTTTTTSTTMKPSTNSITSTSISTTIPTTTTTTPTTMKPSTTSITSTSTSTTIPTTSSTTSTTMKPSTNSITSTSISTTIPTTSTTTSTTMKPSTTSITSTSTSTTIPTTTTTTSTTMKPSTTSTTSTSTSTTIPTTTTTTSTTMKPSTTSITSTSTSTTIPTTTTTTSTTVNPSTTSITSTSTFTTIPTTTTTTSTTMKPSTTSATSTSTSTTIPTTTTTTSTTMKPSTTSTTSTSTSTTIPTTTTTTSATMKPSTTSATSTSTSTTIPTTTTTTSTTMKPSTTSTTSTSTSTTIPTTTTTTSATMKPSTTSATSTSTSTTIPTTTTTTSTTMKPSTTSTTSTSTSTTIPTTTTTISATMKPSTTSATSTSTSTTIPTTTTTTSTTMKPSTTSTTSTSTSTTIPTTTTTTSATMKPSTTSATSTSTSTTIPTTTTTTSTTMKPSTTSTTSTSTCTTIPTTTTTTSTTMKPSTTSTTSTSTSTTIPTTTITTSTTVNPSTTSITSTSTSTTIPTTTTTTSTTVNPSTTSITSTSTSTTIPTTTTTTSTTVNPSTTSITSTSTSTTIPTTTTTASTTVNPSTTSITSTSTSTTIPTTTTTASTTMKPSTTSITSTSTSTTTPSTDSTTATTTKQSTASTTSTSRYTETPGTTSDASSTNTKLITNITTSTSTTTSPTIAEPSTTSTTIATSTSTTISTATSTTYQPPTKPSTASTDSTSTTVTLTATASTKQIPTTKASTSSSETTTTAPTVDKTISTNETMMTTTQQPTTIPALNKKTEIYFGSSLYLGFVGSFFRLTCQAIGMSQADLQTITLKRSSTSNETEFVASISVNGTKNSDFQDISISSESIMNSSKAMIHLDFHKLVCADNGTYYCIAGNYSATGELNIYRKPELPVLTFPLGVLENEKGTFGCSGEVGYPPGTIVLETNNGDGKTFVKAPFSSTSNVIHGNCSAVYNAVFSFNFTLGWNNTIVRCKVEKSQELNDNETLPYVDKILLIVPANICGTSNTLYVPQPYDCHKYIQCGMQTYLRDCPAGLCRFTQPHNETYCERTCDNCTAYQISESTTVRNTPEEKTTSTFQTTITTSGNITISISNIIENQTSTSTRVLTTTENVSDKTVSSTTVTTAIYTEIYFTSTSYSGYIGSSIRLTCQVQQISSAALQSITIKRSSTSSGTEFVASISVNGTKRSDFQDISISSENFMNSSNVTIHVDFHKLACIDEGTYYCIIGDVFATGSLNILKKPEKPILSFPQGVLENSQQDMFNCTGDVGHPPGNIVFETNKDDVKTFIRAPFTPTTNVIHGHCSATYSATFSYKFNMDWSNTIIRCRAENSKALDDNETSPYVDKTLFIIPANICGTSNTLYVPQPYDCHKYIQCGMQTYLRDCPAGLCRFTQPHNETYCERTCDNCTAYQISESTTVRNTPEEKTTSTFQTTITTSGNITISISNIIENQTSTSTRVLTTTENVSDKTVSSTTVTTAIYTEIYFTSTSYSGYIGSSIRLTCQVQQISSAALQSITIKRSSTSSGTEFVASISVNGTKRSDFQDISISSENFMNSSNVTIHVDFHKLACIDEGTYYCIIGDVFATGSLNILKKPEKPILTFPQGVLENSQQDMFNCTGDVGHPPGNIVFETNKDDVKTFIRAPFTPTTNVIHGHCSATYSATFSYKFNMDWSNTIIRCRAENSKALDDNETSPYVDKTLFIIPANICGTSNTLYVPQPYDCHKYIQCGMQTYLRDCPAGLCRFTQPHNETYCERTCDNCTAYQISESTTVRMTPEEKTTSTFQTTITTSGNITISISNIIENQTSTSTRVLTTTENVSDKTVSSTTVTTAIYTEIYFTSTSYSGYIGSSIRLTCQVQQISSAALQSITIKRSSTSSGTEFVASISVNGTKRSDFQDISISSENFMNSSNVTIHVDFHKLACIDEGTYYCIIGDVFATGSLNILKKPEKPILTFPQGVLENSQQDMFNCTGDVGHPPGNIVFETNKDDVKTFIRAPFTPTTNVIHGHCSATYSATFSYKFNMDWSNTIIRCRAENSKALDDNETSPYVDKTLFIIPANICGTSNTLYVPQPYDCHKYIQCGMQTYLRDCPAGLCRFTQPHNETYCERTCDNCTAYQISESTTVRMTPEEKTTSTFQTTITTSGNKTKSISNRIENQTSISTRVLTTTENVSDKTVSSTTVTTAIYTEIYFTSTSYSGYIGSSIRLTCQVQQISSAALQSITIKRSSTSSGTEFVASISVNGTKRSDFQDISISSENFMNSSNVTIHVDFHKLACIDEGTYYCIIGDVFATGSLNILKKPEKPILTFPQGVLENSQQDMFNCTGDVGHPPGNIVFETNKDDVKTFIKSPFSPTTNVIHGNCSATYSATFTYKFTMDWNNTIIRCKAENSKALDDNETSPYVDKKLFIVPANICGTSNTLYVPQPYDCHKYIQCGMQTYLRDCPAGLCRYIQPHNETYCERTCDNCTVSGL